MDHEAEFLAALAQAGGEGSMWDIGREMGLDRGQAEAVGTELMGRGLLEMVSLSGKVRLTETGRAGAERAADQGGETLADWLAQARALDPAGDLAQDLACLEAQLARSQPLTEVVATCLEAAAQSLAVEHPDLADRARRLKP